MMMMVVVVVVIKMSEFCMTESQKFMKFYIVMNLRRTENAVLIAPYCP